MNNIANKMNIIKKGILMLLFLFMSLTLCAKQDNNKGQKLKPHLIEVNDSFLFKGSIKKSYSVSQLSFGLNEFTGQHLEINVSSKTWLFLNNKLIKELVPLKVLQIDIDSIREKEYKKDLLFTFYSQSSELPDLSIYPLKKKKTEFNLSFLNTVQNKSKDNKQYIISTILMLLIFGVYLFLFDTSISLNSIKDWFFNIIQGAGFDKEITLKYVLIFLMFYSLFIAYILFFLLDNQVFNDGFLLPLFIVLILLLLVFRMFYTYFITLVFYNIKIFKVYLKELINTTHFLLSLLAIITFLIVIGGVDIKAVIMKFILISLLLFKSILILIRVNKRITFKKMYLFAYFCSIELIPAVFSIKILMFF